MPRFVVLMLFALPGLAFGQLLESFSDGDFTQDPEWQGTQADFVVNPSGVLQLQAATAGVSYLATPVLIYDSTLWTIDVRMPFAPSASNKLRLYLMADQLDLVSGSGYFVEIGENGSADALRFFRQDAGVPVLLASGVPGAVAQQVDATIRAHRNALGQWRFEMRQGGADFDPQCEILDGTYGPGFGYYFGFQCQYTASRSSHFFFDNIAVQEDIPDTLPPRLLAAEPLSERSIRLLFDEPLDTAGLLLTRRYVVQGIGQPLEVTRDSGGHAVRLKLGAVLVFGQTYAVAVDSVSDVFGNLSAHQQAVFEYRLPMEPGLFDVLINEIMADPSPSAGLPEVEWLELLNRSAYPVNMSSLTIRDAGSSRQRLPDLLLGPGEYMVLTTPQGVEALRPFVQGAQLGIALPSLNNSGDVLWLERHADGAQIDRIDYADYWHTDAGKKDGGWSLERINPDFPCLGASNWASAASLPGGTPGSRNSNHAEWIDTMPPRLVSIYPIDGQRIKLLFSEGMDADRISDPSIFQIEPSADVGEVEVVLPHEIVLWLTAPLKVGYSYRLQLDGSPADCSGNALVTREVYFGLPEAPNPGDICINELMYNPPVGGSRYVELYNKGNRMVDVSRLFLYAAGSAVSVHPIVHKRLLEPGGFLVLSGQAHDIHARFRQIDPDRVLEMGFPALDAKTGTLSVYWADGAHMVVMDSLTYRDDWHTGFLTASERKGVALERIRADGPSNDPSNWTSASTKVTGAPGTPTLPNSQTAAEVQVPAGWAWLSKGRLSPDADGFEDFLEVQYQLPAPGYVARVSIFGADGQLLRQLVPRALAGTEGTWRWDGDTENKTLARPGIYVFQAEAMHPEGDVRTYRQAFALVGRR